MAGSVAMGFEALDDGEAGLVDVAAADGLVGERSGDGDGAVEVVGVRGAERRDGKAGLGEAGGELRVRVHDGADGGELAIEQRVGVEVGGGTEVAFDDLAVEVGDDHLAGLELVVVDAGGLDDDEALFAVDAARRCRRCRARGRGGRARGWLRGLRSRSSLSSMTGPFAYSAAAL